MRPQFLNVENSHTVGRKYLLRCKRSKIREVLMVDLVELIAEHRLQQVRKFDRADAPRLQDDGQAFDKGIEVRNLGKNVIANNQVGLDTLLDQFSRYLDSKKTYHCRNPALSSGRGHVRRGVDAEDRNALAHKELQEVSIVAADFNHPARRPE